MEKIEKFVEDTNKSLQSIQEGLNGKVDEKTFTEAKEELDNVKNRIEEISKVGDKSLGDYIKGLQEHADQLEGKLKEIKENGYGAGDSLEQQLKESLKDGREQFLQKARKGEDGIELKASDVNVSNSFTNTYYEAVPTAPRLPGIQQAPFPQPTVWGMINAGTTNRRYIPYVERTGYTSGASMVAEGSAGGQADASYTDKVATVKKIKGYLVVDQDSLEDIPYLRSEIQRILNHDIVQKRENQLLTGSGNGNDLQGFIYASNPLATAFAKPSGFNTVNGPDTSTVLNAAMAQVQLGIDNDFETGYMANAIVLHPTQIANMVESRDNNAAYRKHPYLSPDGKSFNGATIVPSKFIDNDTFLVGDFSQARAYVRRGISMKLLDQHGTYGTQDKLVFDISFRVAFYVPSPHGYAFSYGTFDSALSSLTKATG